MRLYLREMPILIVAMLFILPNPISLVTGIFAMLYLSKARDKSRKNKLVKDAAGEIVTYDFLKVSLHTFFSPKLGMAI